jgi:hypothetical protein
VQVAYLAGNKAHSEREIRHVAAHPIYDPEAALVRQDLQARTAKSGS